MRIEVFKECSQSTLTPEKSLRRTYRLTGGTAQCSIQDFDPVLQDRLRDEALPNNSVVFMGSLFL